MGRFVTALLVAVVLSLFCGGVALGGTQWCVVDPVIVVNGHNSDVQVAFDQSNAKSLSGPIVFRFHVPSNAAASVAMPPSTVPYTVQLSYDLPAASKHSPNTVTVETLVSASTVFATQTLVDITRTVSIAVIAVADAWDAMTSDRPYRRALTVGEARTELLRHRGSQWAPTVVDALLAIVAEPAPIAAGQVLTGAARPA
jgi:hypothetical protein